MRRNTLNRSGYTCDLESLLIRQWVQAIPSKCEEYSLVALPNDRWLLGSALQKGIRRGLDVESSQVAVALHQLNSEYAWRRLRVIALEDVGVGDAESVATLLALAGKRKLREALGDKHLYLSLVQALTVSVKDRTACDLLCWVEFSPAMATYREELLKEPARWESIALDEQMPIAQRVMALQLIAGLTVRTRAGYKTLSRADPERWRRVIDALPLHPLVALATRKGSGTEGLNVALPLAYLLHQQANVRVSRIGARRNDHAPLIGGLPAWAFDMHTRPGLRALRSFLKSESVIRRCLTEAGATDQIKALGFLVFQTEGGLLDRYEDYAPQVRIEAERAELAQYGIQDDNAATLLRTAMKKRLPVLHAHRQLAWDERATEHSGEAPGA